MSKLTATLMFVLAILCVAPGVGAADRYFHVPVAGLVVMEGTLPDDAGNTAGAMSWRKAEAMQPYVVLDDLATAEAYVGGWEGERRLTVRAPNDMPVTGTLFMPLADRSGMTRVHFRIPENVEATDAREFFSAKLQHYQDLRRRGIAGAAWFRYQQQVAAEKAGVDPDQVDQPQFNPWVQADELTNTYALFSGGRAVSENLQLDRVLLPSTQPATLDVDVDSIEGITVREMNWAPLIEGKNPQLDPLAALVPADQHAIFFPSVKAARAVLDEAERRGSLMLIASALAESRSEDAQTRQRYETQLFLSLDKLEALDAVKSVALTGSDPYVRVGTDVAVLVEGGDVATFLTQQLSLVRLAEGQPVEGEIDGVNYGGVVSPSRMLSSYWASVGDFGVVTNSLAQLARIVSAHKGDTPALSSLPEYRFFRDRYARGAADETALLVLSDATIRRWCGPRWRIADSRRTRAMALLADVQARSAESLVHDNVCLTDIEPLFALPDLGEPRVVRGAGVTSPTYGSLQFMTPIAEINIDKVSQAEADSYARWRDTYQANWRQFFDPIAAKMTIGEDGRLAADVTVMPLIAGTEYREFISLSQGASLDATSGDPHPEAIGHLVIALNPQSPQMLQFGQMMQGSVGLRINPLAWVGKSAAVYADADPFWDELSQAVDSNEFMRKQFHRLPVALHVEATDAMRLAAFLTAVHAMVDQSAPGMLKWEKLMHGERSYVKVSAVEDVGLGQEGEFAVYYAATPKALVLSLNEDVIKRATDRQQATTQPASDEAASPWLGSNVALRLDRQLMRTIAQAAEEQARAEAQVAAWSNIPILNEWKRLYPDRDPLEVHAMLWKTRLTDPAGGTYAWNERWQTMESENYGHPGEQKAGPAITSLLEQMNAVFGLTFENDGLRARAALRLPPPPPQVEGQ